MPDFRGIMHNITHIVAAAAAVALFFCLFVTEFGSLNVLYPVTNISDVILLL